MPMQLTVSRNRKTSENYNSQGYGVSLTVELDQSLLTKPQELQDKIAYLYREAEEALDKQAREASGSPTRSSSSSNSNGNGHRSESSNGNGRPHTNGHRNGNGNGNERNGHGMTTAQRRAIQSIGQRMGVDVIQECRHELGAELDQLSVKQASRFIDHLKQMEQPVGQNGGGR